MHHIVAHYHEVGLKGRNRDWFQRVLASNIKTRLAGAGEWRVRQLSGRLLVSAPDGADLPRALREIGQVFGLSSFSPCIEAKASMPALVETALSMAGAAHFASFRIRARRGNTSFPDTSQTINEVVGKAVKDASGAAVDLTAAEWTCHIEVVGSKAYCYSERLPGPGGLPVGVSGRVMALLSGGIDSPVAAWEVAKRGARVDLVHFHGQPFTDPSSARQAGRLAAHLAPWLGGTRLFLVPFGDIQATITTECPQEMRVVLYRRFMARIAEAAATSEGALAIVTGDSLGQVASQTLPNLLAVDSAVERLMVFRPLIGRDKIEIEARARSIGTYAISTEPHQDCCVLFVPRDPATRVSLEQVAAAEARLDIPALVEKALANIAVERFRVG